MDADVQRLAAGLQAALEDQQAALAAKEAQLRARSAAVAQVEALLAAGDVPVSPGDIVTLNVGGTVFTTSRATLTLVPDSLLGVMFSGRWEANSSEEPPPFLDLDPDLFAAVLSWLRMYGLRGGQQRLLEPAVSEGRKEQFMVLLDFLQLHKHIPVTWPETWCQTLHTRDMRVVGTSVTRLEGSLNGSRGVDPAHSLSGTQQEQRFNIINVASSAHSFYDVQVELDLEVVHFGADVDTCLSGPMVIGVMARSVLEQVLGPQGISSSHSSSGDSSSKEKKDTYSSTDDRGGRDQGAAPSNADAPATTAATTAAAPDMVDGPCKHVGSGRAPRVTTEQTFYGFFTDKRPVSTTSSSNRSRPSATTERRGEGYTIRNGGRCKAAAHRLLWHQGDTLRVTLDCRHHLEHPRLKLLNTVTLEEHSLECQPHPVRSLVTTSGAGSGRSTSHRRRAARLRGGNRVPAPPAAALPQARRLAERARQGVDEVVQQLMEADAQLDLLREADPDRPEVQGQIDRLDEHLRQQRARAVAMFADLDEADRLLAAAQQPQQQPQQQQAGGGGGAVPRALEGPPSPRGPRGAGPGFVGQQRVGNGPPAAAAAQAHPPPQQQQQQAVLQALAAQAGLAAPAVAAADGALPANTAGGGQTVGEAAVALLPPAATTPQEWVLVVGLTRPGDQVRLLSARRVGQHPVTSMG